jgi:hypothetical protein
MIIIVMLGTASDADTNQMDVSTSSAAANEMFKEYMSQLGATDQLSLSLKLAEVAAAVQRHNSVASTAQ